MAGAILLFLAMGLVLALAYKYAQRRRVRFGLSDLLIALLCFGAVLAAIRFFMEQLGYPLGEHLYLVPFVALLICQGFVEGLRGRDRIREKFARLRFLLLVSYTLAPATVFPAFIVAYLLVFGDGHELRNSWYATLAWLFLAFPPAIAWWFHIVNEAHKRDKPES